MLKSKFQVVGSLAFWLAAAAPVWAQAPSPLLTQPADKLIAVLQSPAGHKEKADACRQLAVVGTKDAVPALAALLADEKLNHMARFALETIPDASAAEALCEALGRLQGRPLVGVIASLGVRREAKAVEPLGKFLADTDADVVQTAARALGKIATPAAVQSLRAALPKAAAGHQLAVCEGLFRCAETLAARGQRKEAVAIYDELRGLPGPHHVRTGALRGAILARQKEGLGLLREQLGSQDYLLFAAAVRTALEMTDPAATAALVGALGQAPADNQILLLQALGKRRDGSALRAVVNAVNTGGKPVRLAALHALAELGGPTSVAPLQAWLRDADAEVAQTAREALASLRGPEADAAVVAMLGSADADQRLLGLELVGRRRMTGRLPALIKAAADVEPKVRPVALKRLGELGDAGTLATLLELLLAAKATPEVEAAEQAVVALCARLGDPDASAAKVTEALAKAQPEQKSALLGVLNALGGAGALKAVRAAVKDPDAGVRAAAIRALGTWRTADAAPDLLELARNAENATDKRLCLRSYLGLAANPELAADARLGMCRQAAALVQQTEDKKLLLAALGSVHSADSLGQVLPYLDDAAVKEEAATACVVIAEKLLQGPEAAKSAAALLGPLEKVGQGAGNASLMERAKTLLEQARTKAK